jgi:biotin transporter BioY
MAWFGMVFLAIGNGVIREKFYSQSMFELAAHQLSALIVIILFGYILLYMCSIVSELPLILYERDP